MTVSCKISVPQGTQEDQPSERDNVGEDGEPRLARAEHVNGGRVARILHYVLDDVTEIVAIQENQEILFLVDLGHDSRKQGKTKTKGLFSTN